MDWQDDQRLCEHLDDLARRNWSNKEISRSIDDMFPQYGTSTRTVVRMLSHFAIKKVIFLNNITREKRDIMVCTIMVLN